MSGEFMKNLHYISDIMTNNDSKLHLQNLVNEKLFTLLMQENAYPTLEYDEDYSLFVLLLPTLNKEKNTILLVECNILISNADIYIMSNTEEPLIHGLIDYIQEQKLYHKSTIYPLITKLTDHIIHTIYEIEHMIRVFKRTTIQSEGYTEENIESIMKFKFDIGMLKSTIDPLDEIIQQLFQFLHHSDEVESARANRITYVMKQIISQTNFLYENISILADTAGAIQSVKANGIMKTLTIISSIFIPLSFVTGILGMNFSVPELYTNYNFYIFLVLIAIMASCMYSIFKYKKRF